MKASVPHIVVVGSLNMDLVVRAPRRPNKGETVFGTEFAMFCGGKGFNQSVAAARLGAAVSMVGRVGADYFGDQFLHALAEAHVESAGVVRDETYGTGVGLPVIGADGDNSIVVVPRANMAMRPADVERAADQLSQADVLLLQLEVPQAVSLRAAQIAKRAGATVILNPAPASPLEPELCLIADVLVPNEQETFGLTGTLPSDESSLQDAAQRLKALGAHAVILTLGARGAYLATPDEQLMVEGFVVDVVDTTGAGDAFCGALAVALAKGMSLGDSSRFANAAGALSVTRLGASPALPTLSSLTRFLAAAA